MLEFATEARLAQQRRPTQGLYLRSNRLDLRIALPRLQYETAMVATGGSLEPGEDAPHPVFSTATKLVTPASNLSAVVFVSNHHSMKENMGVHSPGPAAYSPEKGKGMTHTSPAHFSLSLKAPSYFDAFLDPTRQTSPGPIYHTGQLDRRGNR